MPLYAATRMNWFKFKETAHTPSCERRCKWFSLKYVENAQLILSKTNADLNIGWKEEKARAQNVAPQILILQI